MAVWLPTFLLALALALWGAAASSIPAETRTAPAAAPLTVGDARTLPTAELAKRLLGAALASKVVEAVRQEDHFSEGTVPGYVEFYTQPVQTDPRIHGICRTDVITVEYDLTRMQDGPVPVSEALTIAHIEAVPRYKSFPMPPGPPLSPKNAAAQAAACAAMHRASDAFRAPSAGDAQWLDTIEHEYTNPLEAFPFSCDDTLDRSCALARRELPRLSLARAIDVRSVECTSPKMGGQSGTCYHLRFPRGQERCSDRLDRRDFECTDVAWEMTVVAGMADGSAPVRIRSLHLERQPEPFSIH